MHIQDSAINLPALVVCNVIACGAVVFQSRKASLDGVPRVGLLSAVFFVVSAFHISLGSTTVHLMLNGLIGLILGPSALIAVASALLMQAILLAHGGLLSLGVNLITIGLPAVICFYLFSFLCHNPERESLTFCGGFLAGFFGIFFSSVIFAALHLFAGMADFSTFALVFFSINFGMAIFEGVVAGFTVVFLMRVQPDLLQSMRKRSMSLGKI